MKVVIIFVVVISSVYSQTVRKAILLEHRSYMIEVAEETVKDMEDYQWCNLKIPDFSQDLHYEIFGRDITGTVAYKNGYVVTIQHLDLVQNSIQQKWTWRSAKKVGEVEVTAQMRLHDVMIGFDVEAVLDGKPYRYNSNFTHRIINLDFSILKNMASKEITVTVKGTQSPSLSSNKMSYLPSDDISDLIGTLFNPKSTEAGVALWGTEVFTPIAYNVVTKKVDFPEPCYNC